MSPTDIPVSHAGPHVFGSDQPIRTKEEDRLDVDPFVRRLMRPLLRAPSEASLVVGLYGQWGHGKSSALNLLENALREAALQDPSNRPRGEPLGLVVRFTPWLYASVETLLPAFFETLAASVGDFGIDEAQKGKWRTALKGMGEFVGPAIKLGALVVAGPGASAAAGTLVNAVADVVSGSARGAAEALAGGEASFRKKKDEAANVLKGMADHVAPTRLVVLIDDLDRAAGIEEVLAMLKLVKLVADLPNVSYVLAMDRARVHEMLGMGVSKAFGDDFLDKIVQVPITLPPIYPERLSRLLIEDAMEVADSAGLDSGALRVDWEKWEILRRESYESRIRPTLRTLRDVVRIVNTFRFAALTGNGVPEVHPVDLLLLSLLQVLYPAVYEAIRKNRHFLLHDDFDLASLVRQGREREEARERRRERLREIAGTPGGTDPEVRPSTTSGAIARHGEEGPPVLAILRYLFPRAEGERLEGLEAQRARNELRIYSPERFDGYFRLQPPEDEVPQREALDFYDALVRLGQEGHPSDEWAPELGDDLRSMPERARESLFWQLDDRAAAMTADEARGLAKALAPLARASAGTGASAIRGLAAHALRAISARSGADQAGPDDIRLGAQMLLDLIEGLPAFEAADYANDLTRSDALVRSLGEDNRRALVDLALQRSLEGFEATPNVFATLGPRAGLEAIWAQYFLAERTGAATAPVPFEPLQLYLEQLLERDPTTLSDILSLAAGWGDGPSFRMRHTAAEVLSSLGGLLDVSLIERHARSMVGREGGPGGNWPHLVEEFVGLLGQISTPAPAPARQEGQATGQEAGD